MSKNKENDGFSIDCLTGIRKLKVSLFNKFVAIQTIQKIKNVSSIEDKEIASVKLNIDGLLSLLNEIHSCLPLTIKTEDHADKVHRIGFPIAVEHLQNFTNDRNTRYNNISNRGLIVSFTHIFIESASDNTMKIFLNVCKDLIDKDKGCKHSKVLMQHLMSASSQLQNTINLKTGVINDEIKEEYFWGAPCDDVSISFDELIRDVSKESKTE